MFNDGDFALMCKLSPELNGVVEEGGADGGLLMLFGGEVGEAVGVLGTAEFWGSWTVCAVGCNNGVASCY